MLASPGLCLVKVTNQTGIGPVNMMFFTPSTIEAQISALNFTVTGSGLICSAAKLGDYSGQVTFEGTTSSGVQTAIKVLP